MAQPQGSKARTSEYTDPGVDEKRVKSTSKKPAEGGPAGYSEEEEQVFSRGSHDGMSNILLRKVLAWRRLLQKKKEKTAEGNDQE